MVLNQSAQCSPGRDHSTHTMNSPEMAGLRQASSLRATKRRASLNLR
jgi:hypothetical protein